MSGIFLDRDGVIIRKANEGDYVQNVSEMHFLPGALEAIVRLSWAGLKVIVITNQRGVATGKIKLADLEDIHARLKEAVSICGGEVCDIFFCPHDISDDCTCRKPKTGMLLLAATKYHLALSECWMVGDAASDIKAGKSAGCRTALITPSGGSSIWPDQPDIWAESLALAVPRLLRFASVKAPG